MRGLTADDTSSLHLQAEAKHEYFVLAPILANGMAVLGDTDQFVTMADMRVPSVEATREAVRVGVISNGGWNPVTVGYAAQRPAAVFVGERQLVELGSLDRLKAEKAGWFWDHQTKLWHVKIDFTRATIMETRFFEIH